MLQILQFPINPLILIWNKFSARLGFFFLIKSFNSEHFHLKVETDLWVMCWGEHQIQEDNNK